MVARQSGSSIVEFIVMISVLTSIGILIMWTMTYMGSSNAIGVGQTNAVNAIKND